MKELSIEEKAKRYDEAIEELRGLLEGIHEEKCEIMEEDITNIFPELKESKDERIRKTLIEYFNTYPKDYYGELKKSDILAWLEKQGEQKPAWSEEDEEMLYCILNVMNGGRTAIPISKYTNWLKSLKERVKGE